MVSQKLITDINWSMQIVCGSVELSLADLLELQIGDLIEVQELPGSGVTLQNGEEILAWGKIKVHEGKIFFETTKVAESESDFLPERV